MMEELEYRMYTKPAELSKSVNTLSGMLKGIDIDGKISNDEAMEIINWCSLHRHLIDRHPFSEILPMIDSALEDGELSSNEIDDILYVCHNCSKDSEYYNILTATIQELQGIIHGIMSDNYISDEEIFKLSDWLAENDFLKGTYPFDEIDSLLTVILKDHVISDDERNILTGFLGNFVDTTASYNINEFELKNIKNKYKISGICAVCPELSISGKSFCFTGTSSKITRKEFENIVTGQGGIYHNSVTQKTDYLIVGNSGNPCWAFSCYGRKVEKAIELRKKGLPIIIVHENDFWDAID